MPKADLPATVAFGVVLALTFSSVPLATLVAGQGCEPATTAETICFEGRDIAGTLVRVDRQTNRPEILVTLAPVMAERLSTYTSANVGRRVSFRVDGTEIFAPVIQGPLSGGQFILAGTFTREQAEALAARLRSGAVTVRIERAGD